MYKLSVDIETKTILKNILASISDHEKRLRWLERLALMGLGMVTFVHFIIK